MKKVLVEVYVDDVAFKDEYAEGETDAEKFEETKKWLKSEYEEDVQNWDDAWGVVGQQFLLSGDNSSFCSYGEVGVVHVPDKQPIVVPMSPRR